MYVLKFQTLADAQAHSRAEAAKHIENHTTATSLVHSVNT